MRRIFCIALGLLVALPATLPAEPLLSFGPDVPLFITAAASVRYDDNVNLTPTNRQGDTIYVLIPGTDFHYSTQVFSAGLTLNEQFINYASKADSQLNGQLANLAGNLSYTGSETQFATAASYIQQNQSTLAISSINQTIQQSVAQASANGSWGVTAKTRLGVGASFARTEYPETGFNDSDVWSFPANVYYAVAPKLDLTLGYTRSRTTLADGIGDTTDDFYNVGAQGDFTPKLTGQFQVGITQLEPDGATSLGNGATKENTLGVGSSFVYQLSPKSTLNFSANSGFSTSPLGTNQKVYTIGANGNFALSEAWSVTLGGTYNDTAYLTAPPIRTDHFWVGDLGLTYIWTSTTQFEAQYIFRKDSTTLAYAGFDDNVVTLTASSKF